MKTHPKDHLNLVADIGGTNTRIALANGAALVPETAVKYANSNYSGLNDILRQYILDQGNVDCAGVCVAVAGPVRDGIGHMTNLNWTIDRKMLTDATNAEQVAILNDLQAQGHGLSHLPDAMLLPVLSTPSSAQNAARLVVGVGTGFNAAVVYHTRLECLVPPSEVGHTDLPVQCQQDFDLLPHIKSTHGFCANDDVLSGRGLESIYQFQAARYGQNDTPKAAEIMGRANNKADEVVRAALQQFIRLLGSVTANLALTYLPFGGISFSGGVARAMAPFLQDFGFSEAFVDKGRFSEFMSDFPVSVILDDDAALTGCASFLQSDR